MCCCFACNSPRAVTLITAGGEGREAGQQLLSPLVLFFLISLNNSGPGCSQFAVDMYAVRLPAIVKAKQQCYAVHLLCHRGTNKYGQQSNVQ